MHCFLLPRVFHSATAPSEIRIMRSMYGEKLPSLYRTAIMELFMEIVNLDEGKHKEEPCVMSMTLGIETGRAPTFRDCAFPLRADNAMAF
jgi:hypothetical protein